MTATTPSHARVWEAKAALGEYEGALGGFGPDDFDAASLGRVHRLQADLSHALDSDRAIDCVPESSIVELVEILTDCLPDHQDREHAVPCARCKRPTFNWNQICGAH